MTLLSRYLIISEAKLEEKVLSYLLAFTDIETTGNDPLKLINGILVPWHEIIDLAAVIVRPEDNLVVGEFKTKIKPEHPERCLPHLINQYPKRAAAGEWDDAPHLTRGMNMFLKFLASLTHTQPVVLGGQNFFFDWSFLTVAFAECGYGARDLARHFHYSHFDTRSMAMQELRGPKTPFDPADWSIRKEKLVERLGLEPEPRVHTAINGARKSFEVFRKLEEIKRIRKA